MTFHVLASLKNRQTVVGGVPDVVREDEMNKTKELQSQLLEKNRLIAQLQDMIQSLKLETSSKDLEISDLRTQLQQWQQMPVFQVSQPAVVPESMEVDDNYINNVVDIAMNGMLEDIGTPAKRQRVAVVLLQWADQHDRMWTLMVH